MDDIETPAETTDADLLHRWQEGDGKAGSLLLERYYSALQRYFAVRVHDREKLDLLQDTFTRLLAAKPRIQIQSFRAYLFAIANHVLIDHFRSTYRKSQYSELTSSMHFADSPSLSSMFSRQEQAMNLLRAMRNILTLDECSIVVMHYWEGLSYVQIAESGAVQGTAESVKSKCYRARTKLRNTLKDEENDSVLSPADSSPHNDNTLALVLAVGDRLGEAT